MMRALRRILTVACLAVLGGAAYWYFAPAQSSEQQQKQAKGPGFRRDSVPVLATRARLADVPVYLDGVGTVRAFNTVTVRSQVDGKLVKIAFTEGMEVEQGSVIAKIDPTTYQAQYDIAVAKKAQDEAALANAKLDLERYTKLAVTNAVQKQLVDSQKAAVDQLTAQTQSDQASIDNARAILDYTNVVAPITGLTGIRLVDEGNIVRASDTTGIVVITQIKPIAVLFNLPQQVFPDLYKGKAAGQLPVQAIAADGTSVLDDGKVVVINNQIDQTTGTVQLKGEFPNSDVQLWPGQFVNLRVLINTLRQRVVVPTAAVQRGPDGTLVYVVNDNNTVSVRPITVQQQDDLRAVIASGLMAQERVVTTGFGRLSDGARVEVTNAEDAGQVATDPSQRPAGRDGAPKGKGKDKEKGKGKGKGKDKDKEKGQQGAAANAPDQAAADPSQRGQLRGGASKAPGQPAPAAAGAPSAEGALSATP